MKTPYELLKKTTHGTVALDLIAAAKGALEQIAWDHDVEPDEAYVTLLEQAEFPPALERMFRLVTPSVLESWVTEHDRVRGLERQIDQLEQTVTCQELELAKYRYGDDDGDPAANARLREIKG